MPKKVESSRKNRALIYAREHAGLTQKEAGELVVVSSRTFSRWETNAVQIPNRKWNKFLRAVNLTAADIPKPQEHDATKYPVNIEPDAPAVKSPVDAAVIEENKRVAHAREKYRRDILKAAPDITPEKFSEAMSEWDKRNGYVDAGDDLAG